MASTASVATSKMVGFLTAGEKGLGAAITQVGSEAGVSLAPIPAGHIVDQNVPFDLEEKALVTKYPRIHVYSDRVQNLLTEKFRTFSGKVRMVVEVGVSQDRLEGIEEQLRLYVDAVTQVLDANRGTWGQGAFFTGGYEVSFGPVRHGGRNFLQVAKVAMDVDFSE